MLAGITNEDRIRHFDRVLLDWLGGDDTLSMLAMHHIGESFVAIGRRFHMSDKTAATHIRTAKRKLRSIGLNADACNPLSGPAPSTHIIHHG